jgi:serine protease Do
MIRMRTTGAIFGICILLIPVLSAQGDPVRPADRRVLERQAEVFFGALRPAVKLASEGVVEVRVWRKRVAYGTVVAEGTVLTKWSEVENDARSLSCRTNGGDWLPATLVGVYPDADLALLSVAGLQATPLEVGAGEVPGLGSFLAMARPDGEAAAMGVVSVLPRSLREGDRAYLGVKMDLGYKGAGVKVALVTPGTGAAKAGMKEGDIVIGIDEVRTDGSFELGAVLQRLNPGEEVEVKYRRGEVEKVGKVVLGERPTEGQIPPDRMEYMNRMGGHRYSDVREGFRGVIQTDMQLDPEDCGAPVVDLDGGLVGIAIARAGRIKSFVLTGAALKELLASDPLEPGAKEPAATGGREARRRTREGSRESSMESVRRHMEDMRRLMEEMDKSGR